MRLTDTELYALVVRCPRPELLNELRYRARQKIWRKMPRPEGTCGHGARVYKDVKGVMSTGYVGHTEGHSLCNDGAGLYVVWDRNPTTERLKKLLDSLKG